MLAFDMSEDSKSPGLQPGAAGGLERVHGVDELRQSLLMLFHTQPGERRLHPEYGCDLQSLTFEPNDETTAGLAMRLVRRAVARFEPRARIDLLDAGPDPRQPHRLLIQMQFTDLRSGSTGTLWHGVRSEAR